MTLSLRFRHWLLIWIIVGLVLRLALVIASGWRMDYDEAVNGLLALRILRGEFYLFIPPEVVGGTGMPYLLALLFAGFGANPITFRLPGLVLSALYILTTGLLGYHAFGERIGRWALAFAALAPAYLLFVGLKLWNVSETIVLGNILLLLTFHLLEQTHHPRRWLLLMGLVAGLMFWLTWLGFYYYLPVIVLLGWRGRDGLRRGWWAGLAGFVFGSLPFWWFNVPRGFPTFARILNDTPMTPEQIGRVLGTYATDLFPRIVTQGPGWGAAVMPAIAALLYALGLIALLYRSFKLPQNSLRLMLSLFVFSVPLIFALSTHSRNSLPEWNPWGVDATGRYVLMLHTVLPIGLAVLVGWGEQQSSLWWQWGIAALVIGLNIANLASLDVYRAFDSPYYDRLPNDLTPLTAYLDAHYIRHVWADNGIGNVLMFITNGQVLAADYYDTYVAGGLQRFPDVLAAVEAAAEVAYVVPLLPGQENPPIQQALDAAGVTYTVAFVTPRLAVYTPTGTLFPDKILAGLGYQY
ncbi:MAG: hypothetical protein K8L99_23685 [Anaerolineae bacterium]|nr:hypothetical protein [Anaerolineae bacterium]